MNAITIILSLELAIIGSTIYDAINNYPSKKMNDLIEAILICSLSFLATFILQKIYSFIPYYVALIQPIFYILFTGCYRARKIKIDNESPFFQILILLLIIIISIIFFGIMIALAYSLLVSISMPEYSKEQLMEVENIWIMTVLFNFIAEYFFVNKSIFTKLIEEF